jgi:hypothetical protein
MNPVSHSRRQRGSPGERATHGQAIPSGVGRPKMSAEANQAAYELCDQIKIWVNEGGAGAE